MGLVDIVPVSGEADYILDVRGLNADDQTADDSASSERRRWIGVQFECCGVYSRVYKNSSGDAYDGHCPKCLRKIRAPIGSDGTTARFFSAD